MRINASVCALTDNQHVEISDNVRHGCEKEYENREGGLRGRIIRHMDEVPSVSAGGRVTAECKKGKKEKDALAGGRKLRGS